ncbi:MAG: adenylosuccinate lyase [Anaerolineales bacterium]
MTDMNNYASPFSWRYGSSEMRQIWSLNQTRLLWRKLWVVLADVQKEYGLVSAEQVEELRDQQYNIDLDRSQEIEKQIQHDLMAELKVFAEQCPEAGGILHLGATSMDIKDNTLVLQQKAALNLLVEKIKQLLITLAGIIEDVAELPLIAFTHLQPAEPSTLGYRLAQPAQDLLIYYQLLTQFNDDIMGKGFTGAVGSSASFATLLGKENLPAFQEKMAKKLGLNFFDVVSQTYPRTQDYRLLSILAGMGAVLYKFAFDLRILQSPGFGELAEPFGGEQIGSSAMPFKQNPIKAEKINSLGRYLAQLPRIAWDNAAHSLLERTLDDSANRRIIIPEACLCADEMLDASLNILEGLVVNKSRIKQNLENYGPFAATEKLLMLLVKAGADRQKMHGLIRGHSLLSWSAIQKGEPNPLVDLLIEDQEIQVYLSAEQIRDSLSGLSYLGDTVKRSQDMVNLINKKISS